MEDNDLIRSPVQAAWREGRAVLVLAATACVVAALLVTGVAQQAVYGWVTLVLLLFGAVGIWVLRRRAFFSAWRAPEGKDWRPWPKAAAWRRFDGSVAVVLFDDRGALWVVPVDRVFAPEADVEVLGRLSERSTPAVRAGGVLLYAVGRPEVVSAADAVAMRRALAYAVIGPQPGGRIPVT